MRFGDFDVGLNVGHDEGFAGSEQGARSEGGLAPEVGSAHPAAAASAPSQEASEVPVGAPERDETGTLFWETEVARLEKELAATRADLS